MNKKLIWEIALAALLVYVIRVVVVLPFLDENGGFTFTEGNTLPPIVDYFFSTLFFAMIIMMGWVSYFFIPKYSTGKYAKGGWQI